MLETQGRRGERVSERETWFSLLAPTLANGELSGKSLNALDLSFLTHGMVIITSLLWRGLEIIITEVHGHHSHIFRCWIPHGSPGALCFGAALLCSELQEEKRPARAGCVRSVSAPAGEGGWAERHAEDKKALLQRESVFL